MLTQCASARCRGQAVGEQPGGGRTHFPRRDRSASRRNGLRTVVKVQPLKIKGRLIVDLKTPGGARLRSKSFSLWTI